MPLRPMWSANSLPSPRKEIYLIANPVAKPNVQSDTACKAVPFRYRPLRMNALAAWRLPRTLDGNPPHPPVQPRAAPVNRFRAAKPGDEEEFFAAERWPRTKPGNDL